MGRADEARAMLARFGVVGRAEDQAESFVSQNDRLGRRPVPGNGHGLLGITGALTLTALAWSFVNFGVLLWLPSALVSEGQSVSAASALIARSTVIAAPVVLVSAWLYSNWSTKGSLMLMVGIATFGLLGVQLRSHGSGLLGNTTFDLTMLIIGTSGMIAMLLPYASESFPLRMRGRATGWVAGCSKLGGLFAQALSVLGLAPALSAAALAVSFPSLAALLLLAWFGRETRQRDLRELEVEHGTLPHRASRSPPAGASAHDARS
jgi:putative MFS transporter